MEYNQTAPNTDPIPVPGNDLTVPEKQFSGNDQPAPETVPIDGGSTSKAPRKSVFDTTLVEKIIAWLTVPLCYCYVNAFFELPDDAAKIWITVFVLGFLAFGVALHWKERRKIESFLWIGIELVLLAVYLFGPLPCPWWSEPYDASSRVWEDWQLALFLHLFAVYWVLARSDRLAEGETSHMFVWDGITGFFIMPFKNIYLLVTTIISTFKREKNRQKKVGLILLFSLVAVAVGFILLLIALRLLSRADSNFANVLSKIDEFLNIRLDAGVIWRIFLSVHLGLYVYGMLGGSFREEKERFVQRGDHVKRFVEKLRAVPDGVWIGIVAVFSVFYGIFFAVQGSYLFGAFAGTLPKGFSYSTYAREGFFELCRVVLVNFALLWLTFRTCRKKGAALKIAGTVLVLETILFDAVAFAKLFMYIHEYAFTPLRLQSAWLVTILGAACICILVSILTKKKTAKIWFIFSTVALLVTAVI